MHLQLLKVREKRSGRYFSKYRVELVPKKNLISSSLCLDFSYGELLSYS